MASGNVCEDSVSMELIREAFLYQNRFAGKTVVFKIDFPVTETAGFSYLMKDIAILAKTGIKVVIVPGAAEYINVVLREHNMISSFARGERLTTENEMQYVEMAAFHAATRFITALSASRMDAIIGNFVRARGRGVVGGLDYKNTGVVDKIFTEAISRVLDAGMAPILPCIGWSPAGKPYNVSSNGIALAVCAALKAIKLVVITAGHSLSSDEIDAPCTVERSEGGKILRLSPEEAKTIIKLNEKAAENNTVKGKNCAALNLALSALEEGVERVHIVDGTEEGVILRELFSNLGAGVMIHAGEYEAIRRIRNRDIPDMLRLMEPLMQKGILLRRSTEDIQQKKDDYAVFVIDGAIHACAALHNWGEGQAEIAALASDPMYSSMGAGRRLVRYLIEKAARQGCTRVFALTISTQDWFEKLGFREVPVESLPSLKREHYNKKRASKVFALDI
ncbi:MAG: amino-acid N-acetyltransferase [Spirochaetaceae bacterium]|jgi:amino-acid N-acetyltransferase|nr:amino-acid N-acetyltransferase [Spirochaetaceae bacterium]